MAPDVISVPRLALLELVDGIKEISTCIVGLGELFQLLQYLG